MEAGSRQLPARDDWIGWNDRQRERRLHLVVQNSRFLILPWVRVRNLASRVLSMATGQLAGEWERHHRCRPVMIETFVDPTRFDGASYKAANWEMIGRTAGKKSGRRAKPPKDIHVKPLTNDFRDILKGAAKPEKTRPKPADAAGNNTLSDMWTGILSDLTGLARDHDRHMIRRHRALNSLLVILFVFRLVPAPRTWGHDIVLSELWEHCRKPGIPLPCACQGGHRLIQRPRRADLLASDRHQNVLPSGGTKPADRDDFSPERGVSPACVSSTLGLP
ncbi:MAG: DUF4338 domain-containing protein [Rhodobacteraceae bacterium]|nr:DUF4338 domain-containing protein [Paracoccaceae bacterium]